jgi:hypothetical protein
MEEKPASGREHPRSEACEIRDFLLPYLLAGSRIECGDEAVFARALDGNAAGGAEFACGDAGCEEQIARLWIIRAGRPIARGGGLCNFRIGPDGSEHTAPLIAGDGLGALGRGGIACGNGLGRGGFLARVLWDWLLFDGNKRFAGGAIENVNPGLL